MHQAHTPDRKPLVAVVGGPLLHTRLDLIDALRDEFNFVGVGASDEASAAFEKKGLPFRRFRIRRGLDPIGDLGALRELYHIFRELEPLAVHAFQGKLCVWGRLAARWAGVPIVIGTIEGLGSTFAVDRPSRRIIRRVYECLLRISSWHSDLTIFQNHSDRSMLVNRGIMAPDITTIIPGAGCSAGAFQPR